LIDPDYRFSQLVIAHKQRAVFSIVQYVFHPDTPVIDSQENIGDK
jgi:hypothetical protein